MDFIWRILFSDIKILLKGFDDLSVAIRSKIGLVSSRMSQKKIKACEGQQINSFQKLNFSLQVGDVWVIYKSLYEFDWTNHQFLK